MAVNVVAVTIDEQSKAYQALSTLKEIDREDRVELESAAIVGGEATGRLQIPESQDNMAVSG